MKKLRKIAVSAYLRWCDKTTDNPNLLIMKVYFQYSLYTIWNMVSRQTTDFIRKACKAF